VNENFQFISHSTAPPSSIEIEASSHGVAITKQNNKIDVKENQDLMLTCTIVNSKPAAEIRWYRGNSEVKVNADNRRDETINLDNKRFTVTSNLTIKATANDDLLDYSCRAKHQALSPDHPMKTTVQVSVLKAPGEPFIEGYSKGEKLRNGQEMELVCRSYGGNPPAQLIWYKNNRQVVSQYTTSGRDSASTYRFKVQPGDNKARLRCEASNTISDKPLKKEIDLTVLCECSKHCIFSFLHSHLLSGCVSSSPNRFSFLSLRLIYFHSTLDIFSTQRHYIIFCAFRLFLLNFSYFFHENMKKLY
jgi:hypothetical protein